MFKDNCRKDSIYVEKRKKQLKNNSFFVKHSLGTNNIKVEGFLGTNMNQCISNQCEQ
jgi:hypothetical protein